MTKKVFLIPASANENLETINDKLMTLYKCAGFKSCFKQKDFIAIKIHFGEKGNITHIPANYFKSLINFLKIKGGKPFFTDTCVLYRSERSDAVKHLRLADKHGFNLQETDAPVIIADGLRGRNEIEIEIPGELFKKVSIATEAVFADAMIVATHVTGHIASGLGGAIKNLGMGLASRKGKLRQHSSVKPWIDGPKCTGCRQCLIWCPENAITMNGDVAVINEKICIGCGECLAVCNFGAVEFNWETSSSDLQKKMAEHALGAVINKKDKICYFNFLINITKDCDCFGIVQKPLIDDIGILASTDPVAIDKASLDLVEKNAEKSLVSMSYPALDPMAQLQHGKKIGLGSLDYELVII